MTPLLCRTDLSPQAAMLAYMASFHAMQSESYAAQATLAVERDDVLMAGVFVSLAGQEQQYAAESMEQARALASEAALSPAPPDGLCSGGQVR